MAPKGLKYDAHDVRTMKFLLFTDLHQKASVIPKINEMIDRYGAEFTVCLGDVTDMGTIEDARMLLSQVKGKVYAIPGNCDPLDFPEAISDVAVDMHARMTEIDGIRFVGLGGSNITIFGTPFELEEEDITDFLEGNCDEGMVLMTHAPSYGVLDHIPNGMSVGSPAIRDIVDRFHPILAMSGHIHEDVGIEVIDGTTFVNPGPAKDGRMAIVEIVDGKVDIQLIGPTDH